MEPGPNDFAIGEKGARHFDKRYGPSKVDMKGDARTRSTSKKKKRPCCSKLSSLGQKSCKNCRRFLAKRKVDSLRATENSVDTESRSIDDKRMSKCVADYRRKECRNRLRRMALRDALKSTNDASRSGRVRTPKCPKCAARLKMLNKMKSRKSENGNCKGNSLGGSSCRGCRKQQEVSFFSAIDASLIDDSSKGESDVKVTTLETPVEVYAVISDIDEKTDECSSGFERDDISANEAVMVDDDSAVDGYDVEMPTSAGSPLEFAAISEGCGEKTDKCSFGFEQNEMISANEAVMVDADSAKDGSDVEMLTSAETPEFLSATSERCGKKTDKCSFGFEQNEMISANEAVMVDADSANYGAVMVDADSANYGAVMVDADSAKDGFDVDPTIKGTAMQKTDVEFSKICDKLEVTNSRTRCRFQKPEAMSLSGNDGDVQLNVSAKEGSDVEPKTSVGTSLEKTDEELSTLCDKHKKTYSRPRFKFQNPEAKSFTGNDDEVQLDVSAGEGSDVLKTSAGSSLQKTDLEFSTLCDKRKKNFRKRGGFQNPKVMSLLRYDGDVQLDVSADEGSDVEPKTSAGTSLQKTDVEFSTLCNKCKKNSRQRGGYQKPQVMSHSRYDDEVEFLTSLQKTDEDFSTLYDKRKKNSRQRGGFQKPEVMSLSRDVSAKDGSVKPKTSAGKSTDVASGAKKATICKKCLTTLPPTKPGIFTKGGVRLKKRKQFDKEEEFNKLCKRTEFKPRRKRSDPDRKSLYRREIQPETKKRVKKYLNKSVENLHKKGIKTN